MRLRAFGCSLALLLATPSYAHAYIDPGSLMLLWQMLVAALVGLLFYGRRIFSYLQQGVRRLFRSGPPADESDPGEGKG